MTRSFLPRPNNSRCFQRYIATLLLFALAWDLAIDSIPPIQALRNLADNRASIFSTEQGSPADDHSGCGIPGHVCALSHHHFPAVVGTTHFMISVAALFVAKSEGTPAAKHATVVYDFIRGPPSLLTLLHSI
ncbi:MAG: hypothetical protein HYX72_01010 [Acidobacteria bacterium]|nr:hypothetical protein [Acidobacteriota bacterium]